MLIADIPLTDGARIRAWRGQDEDADWVLEGWESVLADLSGGYTELLCPGMRGQLQPTEMTSSGFRADVPGSHVTQWGAV